MTQNSHSEIILALSRSAAGKLSPEPEQPQGGETRSDGAVYVPGFGWVPYEGENSTETAPNAGTGKPVGEM